MKKRSGASYRSKRDNPLELFVDRCLGKNLLPEALRKLPNLIVHVPKVAAKGWVILTKDKDIRHRKLELDAVLNNEAYMLTFGHGDYTAQEMAEAFTLALPKIRRAVGGYFPPLIARITVILSRYEPSTRNTRPNRFESIPTNSGAQLPKTTYGGFKMAQVRHKNRGRFLLGDPATQPPTPQGILVGPPGLEPGTKGL